MRKGEGAPQGATRSEGFVERLEFGTAVGSRPTLQLSGQEALELRFRDHPYRAEAVQALCVAAAAGVWCAVDVEKGFVQHLGFDYTRRRGTTTTPQ